MVGQRKMDSLKQNMKRIGGAFCLPAFVFNSFYLFYKGIRSDFFFIFFLLTPLLYYFLQKLGCSPAASLACAVLIVRLICALTAKKLLEQQRQEQEATADQSAPRPVCYFSVSCLRMVAFSVFSFNIYPIYLSYKNWQAVRNANGEKHIVPFFRGLVFSPIYVFPLFWRMHKSFAESLKKTLLFDVFAILYIAVMIGAVIVHQLMITQMNFRLFNLFMLLQIIKPVMLIPLQHAINLHNRSVYPESRPQKKLLAGEFVVILLAITMAGMIWYRTGRMSIRRFYRNFDWPTRNIIINTYVFGEGYEKICADYGYEMKDYRKAFERIYQKELADLTHTLQEKNMTLEDAWNLAGPRFKHILSRRLEKDMTDLSREMFGTKDSDTKQNMRHFCSFMDMSADMVIRRQLRE